MTLRSSEFARDVLATGAVVFFEVFPDEGEDLLEVARELSELGCSTVVDPDRRVVKVFSPKEMPSGFGFL